MPRPNEPEIDFERFANVFGRIANQHRIRIIFELAKNRRTAWTYAGLEFSELRRRVGMDDSATFHYHLEQLRDNFVVKDGSDYILTDSGLEVADALQAGTFDPSQFDVSTETVAETPCPKCSERLRVRYEANRCAVQCPEHGEFIVNSVPPAAIADHDGEELLRYVLRDIHQEVEDARKGACFHCAGHMAASVQIDEPLTNPRTGEKIKDHEESTETPITVLSCNRCKMTFWSCPRWLLLRHPAVASLFHGVEELRHISFLDPVIRKAASEPTEISDNPIRVQVLFEYGPASAEIVVDQSMKIVRSEVNRE